MMNNSNNNGNTGSENKKIPCAIIRDLFPSYIDGLTSEETNAHINGHVADCPPCREVLDNMRESGQETSAVSGDDLTELDFLKKTKRRNAKKVLAGIAGALALAAAVLFVRFYMIGSDIDPYWLAYKVSVSGSDVAIDGSVADSLHGISKVSFDENDGIVSVRVRAVIASPLHWSDFHKTYTADEAVRQVIVNGRVCWDEGETICARAAAVYATRHDYMGSMPDNTRTADALGISEYVGDYTNELKTSSEPYRWRIIFTKEDQSIWNPDVFDAYGYILIAAIRNLDEVEFVYRFAGMTEPQSRLITKDMATDFFGQDIKRCYDSPRLMNRLVKRTGIDSVPMMLPSVYNNNSASAVLLKIVIDSDEPLASVEAACFSGNRLCSSRGSENADGSLLTNGQTLNLELLPENFGSGTRSVKLTVQTKDGMRYEIPETILLPDADGSAAMVVIRGKSESGFTISEYGTIYEDQNGQSYSYGVKDD